MGYQDVEIEFTAETTGRHFVRVSRSPAGQSNAEPLDLALTSGEINRFASALGRATSPLDSQKHAARCNLHCERSGLIRPYLVPRTASGTAS